MYKLSIIMACIAISLFLVSCGGQDIRNGMEARIMSVFRVDGEHVRLSQGRGGATDARVGMGLHEGHRVSTGQDSYCHINLDPASLVKMDMLTDISIDRLTDSLLRINIESGQVLVDVHDQETGHVLEAIIGNTVISVRGTLFVAGVYARGEAIIIVLEGSVYVNDMPLEAGYVMRVLDGAEMVYEVSPVVFDDLDGFQLSAATDNWDRLVVAGVIDSHTDFDDWNMSPEHDPPYEPVDNGQDDVNQDEAQHAIGDIIRFGDYDWRVLDLQNGRALIITDRVITNRRYHHTMESVTWETSELRQWLNGEFFARFSLQDQERIIETYVVNNDNPWDFYSREGEPEWVELAIPVNPYWFGLTSTPGGSNTVDRIFLLSIDEVLRYFGDSGLIALGATMAKWEREESAYEGLRRGFIYDQFNERRKALDLDNSPSRWWLRSPGHNSEAAVIITSNGYLGPNGLYVERLLPGVRPALWLYLYGEN